MNDNTTTRERPATELEQLLNAPFTEHFASECEYEGTVRMGLLTGYGDVGGLEELMAREVDYGDAADFLDNVRPAVDFIESGIALDPEGIEVIAEVSDHYFDGAPHLRRQYVERLEALLSAVRRAA